MARDILDKLEYKLGYGAESKKLSSYLVIHFSYFDDLRSQANSDFLSPHAQPQKEQLQYSNLRCCLRVDPRGGVNKLQAYRTAK